jgi:DNA-binding CsgD family transcriptional regulator
MLRYLAKGLASTASPASASDVVTVEEDAGIVSLDGAIVRAPARWRALVRLAALGEVSPRKADHEAAAVERFLRRACAALLASAGDTAALSTHETAWGRFAVKAFPLPSATAAAVGDLPDAAPPDRATQAVLVVRREEARVVSLIRGTGVARLSSQQREVALLLAAGRTNREIGDALRLTPNTVASHVKQVFGRLDVRDRTSVARTLLDLAQSAAAR